ncbi:WXG100 family type VII secretion target [Sinomonas halotolerans]|uniref:WXG100 family type VII secretion target n=1 Tax=Sinomonas halotolerans TaxID=1644133 RepID=A0ABU9WZA9_9MICC
MAIQQGANVTELRGVAKQFNAKAGEVENIKNTLNALISNNIPANWAGRDAEQFRNEWQSTGMKSLAKLIEQLREASRTMNQNATAQEQTSNSLS